MSQVSSTSDAPTAAVATTTDPQAEQDSTQAVSELAARMAQYINGDVVARPEDLMLALRQAQQQIEALTSENRTLSAQVRDLTYASSKSGKSKAQASKLDTLVHHIATVTQMLFNPFLTESDLSDMLKPSLSFDDPRQYEKENLEKRIAAELFAVVPASHHADLQASDAFQTKARFLLGHVRDSRGSSIDGLRKLASMIFGVPNRVLGSSDQATADRQQCKRVWKDLLGLTKGDEPLTALSTKPPVLFKDGNTDSMGGMFMSEILFNVARISIYGPAASKRQRPTLRKDSAFADPAVPPIRNQVTPGLIAWCSIMSIYLLSNDKEFLSTGKGLDSKFDYQKRFETYKKLIILTKESNKKWYNKLLVTWQAHVWPKSTESDANEESDGDEGSGDESGGEEEEIAGLLKDLCLTDESDDDEGDNQKGPSTTTTTAQDPNEEEDEEEGECSSTATVVPAAALVPRRTLQRTYAFIEEAPAPIAPLTVAPSVTPDQQSHSLSRSSQADQRTQPRPLPRPVSRATSAIPSEVAPSQEPTIQAPDPVPADHLVIDNSRQPPPTKRSRQKKSVVSTASQDASAAESVPVTDMSEADPSNADSEPANARPLRSRAKATEAARSGKSRRK